jgi:streptomycin 6-kinase
MPPPDPTNAVAAPPDFDPYLKLWRLVPDGAPILTHSSRLLPVLYEGAPAMLKIAVEPDERAGADLMAWWAGQGAARVLALDDAALLLERGTGVRSLAAMAKDGQDDEASRILCEAAAVLYQKTGPGRPDLVPLDRWFEALPPAAATRGGILAAAWDTARDLFATPSDIVVLHGDLHHDNVLDFGPRGWLAIDPKCLVGERGFDFANIFRNPDGLVFDSEAAAITAARLAHRSHVIAATTGIERRRLLQWTLAFAGLSAAWIFGDGDTPVLDLAVAEAAAAELQTG